MTKEKIKALEEDIISAVNNTDLCRLCKNFTYGTRPECEESDYDCESCKEFKSCKCGSCYSESNFKLKKEYGLADEAPYAEDEAGGWISTEERLPEKFESVLVVVNGKFQNITYEDAIMLGDYDRKEDEWFLEECPDFKFPNVKWWRAIPKPPKEGLQMKDKFVVAVTPGGKAEKIPWEKGMGLKKLQELCGGYIETTPTVRKKYLFVVNEEGKLLGLEINGKATAALLYPDTIVGTAVVMKAGRGDLEPMDDSEAEEWLEFFDF